jgi:SAM-dependent methyltransferase
VASRLVMGEGSESTSRSRTREYFSRLYQENEDPWDYESSEYEAEKYKTSLQALPREQYQNAFEIGCSIGVFTANLAPRCRRLLSVDLTGAVLERAKQRCQPFPHVNFKVMSVLEQYPDDIFDLTILSEVGYYLEPEDLAGLSEQITNHAALHGHLLLVHWLAPVQDYPLRGDDVHEHFLSRSGWHLLQQRRNESYRLDVLERHGPDS